jgi:dCTP deaminase
LTITPNKIYLINTLEVMGSDTYVPIIRGRSSIGRLGLFIDITADLIDLGSINKWTLQLHSVMPVKVFKGMRIGQVTFWMTKGEKVLYNGKYKGHSSPVKSFSYKDFKSPHK